MLGNVRKVLLKISENFERSDKISDTRNRHELRKINISREYADARISYIVKILEIISKAVRRNFRTRRLLKQKNISRVIMRKNFRRNTRNSSRENRKFFAEILERIRRRLSQKF